MTPTMTVENRLTLDQLKREAPQLMQLARQRGWVKSSQTAKSVDSLRYLNRKALGNKGAQSPRQPRSQCIAGRMNHKWNLDHCVLCGRTRAEIRTTT